MEVHRWRHLLPLTLLLRESPVVALLGARQIGKSTLARQLAAGRRGSTSRIRWISTARRILVLSSGRYRPGRPRRHPEAAERLSAAVRTGLRGDSRGRLSRGQLSRGQSVGYDSGAHGDVSRRSGGADRTSRRGRRRGGYGSVVRFACDQSGSPGQRSRRRRSADEGRPGVPSQAGGARRRRAGRSRAGRPRRRRARRRGARAAATAHLRARPAGDAAQPGGLASVACPDDAGARRPRALSPHAPERPGPATCGGGDRWSIGTCSRLA